MWRHTRVCLGAGPREWGLLGRGPPADDHCKSNGSAGDASSDGGWSSDNDQGRGATDEDPTTLALRVATLNVWGCLRKKKEVLATALTHKVHLLALTEPRSRTQGTVEDEDYDLWVSGANKAEGSLGALNCPP